MGEVTVVDFAHRFSGRSVGSDKVVRLDPAALGKAIQRHAVPRLPFTNDRVGGVNGIDAVCADAVGAPNGTNLERTSAHLHIYSDAHEARFRGRGPTRDQDDDSKWIYPDDRLSPNTPDHYAPIVLASPNPFWVAPWHDAEMLGHSILTAFVLAGPPIGKGMMPSIFDPLEPRRRTALHRAAGDGAIDALPSQGSRSRQKVDPVDTAGVTPLMLASESGHLGVVERLLQLGASHELRDHQGRSPIHYAARAGKHGPINRLLEAGADPSTVDLFGDTPLHLAAAGGFLESVEVLMQAGADPNAADAIYLSTPLHSAVRGNHAGAIAALIEGGAKVDTPNEAGRTPLHVAAAYGHVEAAEALIRLGADLDCRDHLGETPIHRPVFFQHRDMIALLIEHGASVTADDDDGNTPLHVAGSMNRDAAARLLMDAGADVEARNHEGLTALDLAVVNQHRDGAMEHNAEVAEVLLGYGASLIPERIPVGDRHALWPQLTPDTLLFENGDVDYSRLPELPEATRRLLPDSDDLGNPTRSRTVMSTSLFHDAAIKNMSGLVETLLQHGVSVMTAVRAHGTPLHSVARYGTREMAALLLDRGADLEMPMRNGTLRHYSPYDRNRRSVSLRTPLDMSELNPRPEVRQFLLDRGAIPFRDD